MRTTLMIMLTTIGIAAASTPQTKQATMAGHCRSLALRQGIVGGISSGSAYFTTYDGSSGLPRHQDTGSGTFIVSGELRPRAGQSGVYEADYGIYEDGWDEYGTFTVTLPSTDLDANGSPDFLQKDLPGTVSVTGSGRSQWPASVPFTLSGQLTRSAGSLNLDYNVTANSSNGATTFIGPGHILHAAGTVDYARALPNTLFFSFDLTDISAIPPTTHFTGSTTFTTPNADQVSLAAFTLTDASARTRTVAASSFRRLGNRYLGTFKLSDGLLTTSWKDYAEWAIEITDPNDADANSVPDLSDPSETPDVIKPTVTIRSPAPGARLTNATVSLRGTARDNIGLARVLYQINNGDFQIAVGTSEWSANASLLPGPNTIRVKAVDLKNNESTLASRTITYVVVSPLTLYATGGGTVVPNLNGRLLEVGKVYLMTALPAAGQAFSNWTGNLTTNTAKLSFAMQSNMVLQANFVTNPFVALKGTYRGLFYENGDINRVEQNQSGSLAMTISDRGGFSGTLKLGGANYPLSGQFTLGPTGCQATKTIPRRNASALTVTIHVAYQSAAVTGEVTDGTWQSALAGYRAPFKAGSNPWTTPAKLTWLTPGSENPTIIPGGNSYGTMAVNASGTMNMNGRLADGTPITQSLPLVADSVGNAYAMVFVPLYGGGGSVLGKLAVRAEDVEAPVSWIKPARATQRYYPAGFKTVVQLSGNEYIPPATATTRVLDLTNAMVEFSGGNLSQAFTNNVILEANNKVTSLSTNRLALTITKANGLFSGTVVVPQTGKTLAFKGALLQGRNLGAGFFLGSNQSGRVCFNCPDTTLELRDAWPNFRRGNGRRVQVAGSRAYVAAEYGGLAIFDVSTPSTPVLLGGYDARWAWDVQVVGTLAYVATDAGLSILDVSSPANVRLRGGYNTGSQYESVDVEVVGNVAYLLNRGDGLRILDVSTTKPRLLGYYQTTWSSEATRVRVLANRAYVAAQGSLEVLDVSSPANIRRLGGFATSGIVDLDVVSFGALGNAVIILKDDGLIAVDVSNPASIGQIASHALTASPSSVRIVSSQGLKVYVGQNNLVELLRFDVSPQFRFISLGSVEATGQTRDVQVLGTVLYAANEGGLETFDVGDPAQVVRLGSSEAGVVTSDVKVVGSTAYVAGRPALQIFDVSNPASITRLAEYQGFSLYASALEVRGGLAYLLVVTPEGGALEILDVSNPSVVTRVVGYQSPSAYQYLDVKVIGTRAYLSGQPGGTVHGVLEVLDISNPNNVTPLGSFTTFGPANKIAVAGTLAYLAEYNNGGLEILDVSSPANIVQVGRYITTAPAADLQVVGPIAYVAKTSNGAAFDGTRGLDILDVSNPANVIRLGHFDRQAGIDAVRVVGSRAFVGGYLGPTAILDVSDPTQVSVVDSDTSFYDGVAHLEVVGDLIYAALGQSGFAIFHFGY